jgi:hypothetical protein
MPGIARLMVALFLVWLLGALALGHLGLRRRRWPLGWAQPAMDFATGAALLSTLWTLAALFDLRMKPAAVYLAVLLLLVAGGVRAMLRKPVFLPGGKVRFRLRRETWVTWTVLALLAVLTVGISLNAYSTPMYWDGRYIWGFKAKAIFLEGGLSPGLLSNFARYSYAALDHPIALPVLQAWVYHSTGGVDERLAKLVGLVYWLGIAALLASYLRRRMAWPGAIAASALACQVPLCAYHAGGGAADVPLALHLLAGGLLLADWVEQGQPEDAILSGLMFGTGALVKPEGLSFAVGGAFALLLAWRLKGRQKSPRVALLAISALVLPFLPWLALAAAWSLPPSPSLQFQIWPWPQLLARAGAVLLALGHQALLWQSWELAWVLVGIGFIAFLVTSRREHGLTVLWGLVAWGFAVYTVIYLLHPYRFHWSFLLDTTVQRLLLHVMPLGIAAAAASLLGPPAGETASGPFAPGLLTLESAESRSVEACGRSR